MGNAHVKVQTFKWNHIAWAGFFFTNLSFATLKILWFFILYIYIHMRLLFMWCHYNLYAMSLSCFFSLWSFIQCRIHIQTLFKKTMLYLPITLFQDILCFNNNAWGILMRITCSFHFNLFVLLIPSTCVKKNVSFFFFSANSLILIFFHKTYLIQ